VKELLCCCLAGADQTSVTAPNCGCYPWLKSRGADVEQMADLILVLDPHYGERLEIVAQSAPIWIVDTNQNRAAYEPLRKGNPHRDHREKGAITSYHAIEPENRIESLIEILPQLETHHGHVINEELVFPNGFELEVIGFPVSDEVIRALREFGFTVFVNTKEGFQAIKQTREH
jgi:hypothetical protein